MAPKDPFYQVYEEVEANLAKCNGLVERWKKASAEGRRSESESHFAEIKKLHDLMSVDISDLEVVVREISAKPAKFNISSEEVQKRSRLVSDASARLVTIEKLMKAPQPQPAPASLSSGSNTKAKENLMGGAGGKYAKLQESIDQDNDNFINSNIQQQNQMMKEQDVQLDELGRAVGRLGDMSHAINKELTEQEQIINELHHETDRTSGMLEQGMQKVNKLLKDSDTSHLCIIAVLFVILVVLIALLFI